MSEKADNPMDRIQDLLDGRLTDHERAEVEALIEKEPAYRCAWEALKATRSATRAQTSHAQVPSDLHARVMASLDAEDRKYEVKAVADRPALVSFLLRPVFVSTFALILIVSGAIFFTSTATSPVIAAVTSHYHMCINMNLSCHKLTETCSEMESFFDEETFSMHQRVLRLDDMDYKLAGGCAHKILEREGTFTVYRSDSGKTVACQMYTGDLSELPRRWAAWTRNGVNFKSFEQDGLTMVFWQEGKTVCVLMAALPKDEVVELAAAKAKSV